MFGDAYNPVWLCL